VNKTLIALAAAAVLTSGCAALGLNDAEQGTSGSLAGTAGGATIGSIAGDAGWGAAAGPGAPGGYRSDRGQKAKP
jgi:uncharacterized protein YceK